MPSLVVGREAQQAALLECFSGAMPSSVIVTGGPSAGKTLVVRETAKASGCSHVYLTCVDTPTLPVFLETLLHQLLRGHERSEAPQSPKDNGDDENGDGDDGGAVVVGRCESLAALVFELGHGWQAELSAPVFLIIDDCERFQSLSPQLAWTLTSLPQLTGKPLHSVLMYGASFEEASNVLRNTGSFHVEFPPYSKKEQIELLCSTVTAESSAMLQQASAASVQKVASLVCESTYLYITDMRQTMRLFQDALYLFISHSIEQAILTDDDVNFGAVQTFVFQQTRLLLAQAGQLRLVDPTQPETTQPGIPGAKSSKAAEPQTDVGCHSDLPLTSKRIAIAAFLAANVPPTRDVDLFAKRSIRKKRGKSRGKTRDPEKDANSSRSFPLLRLLAIFASVFDASLDNRPLLLSQIRSLADIGILRTTSGDGLLEANKFYSHVTPGLAHTIARELKVDLWKFL